MRSLNLGLLTGLLLGTSAHATIYMAAIDPATRSVGMAVISSGPVVTYHPKPMTGLKGIGFVGWSGSALNVSPSMDRQVFGMMKNHSTADEIARYVDSQIHDKYSRYLFISALNGTFGYVFPPGGCAQPECGVEIDPTRQFIMMGGGLQKDVVANAMKAYSAVHASPQLPFECKLLLGLQAIINAGGETKEFEEAQIGIDRPALTRQAIYSSTTGEAGTIADLRGQIARAGVACPVTRNAPLLRPKPKRHPGSHDL